MLLRVRVSAVRLKVSKDRLGAQGFEGGRGRFLSLFDSCFRVNGLILIPRLGNPIGKFH